MFDQGWVRFVVASLLLTGYGAANAVAALAGWRQRRPRVRRPVWSHLFGFVSLILFYSVVGKDGGSWWDGLGNAIGIALCLLAMALRVMASGAGDRPRHPDLIARVAFFAVLPLAVGSFRAWLALTLPQAVIAAWEARQRDEAAPRDPAADGGTGSA